MKKKKGVKRGKLCKRGKHDEWRRAVVGNRLYWLCRPCSRATQKRHAQTPGTYTYNRVHGIGKPGAVARVARRTPGTYAYNFIHGIGKAGKAMREKARRDRRTPGTYAYNAVHGIGEAGERARLINLVCKTRQQAARDPERFGPMLVEIEHFLKENGYGQAKEK